jgi:hypothetical protein
MLFGPAGCLTAPVEQRAEIGPKAESVWAARVASATRRSPTFEERGAFQDQLEGRIARFLAQNPQVANAYDVHTFRFEKQVAVGMTKEQVTVLLGGPDKTVSDRKEMEKLAAGFWPQMKDKPSEVWVYPLGWRVFIHDGRVVDLVRSQSPRLPF